MPKAIIALLPLLLFGCQELLGIRAGQDRSTADGGHGGRGGQGGEPTGGGSAGQGATGATGGGGSAPCDANTYAEEVACDAPLAYWPLDGSLATAVLDATNDFDLTVNETTTEVVQGGETGIVADAVRLAGGTLRQDSTQFAFTDTDPMSIEMWLSFPANFSENIMNASELLAFNSNTDGWRLQVTGSGTLQWIREIADVREQVIVEQFDDDATSFTHVVATYDGATMRLFVQGREVGLTLDSRPIPTLSSQLVIGSGNLVGSGTDVSILIDEVAIYPHALSVDRIQAHCATATPPVPCAMPPER